MNFIMRVCVESIRRIRHGISEEFYMFYAQTRQTYPCWERLWNVYLCQDIIIYVMFMCAIHKKHRLCSCCKAQEHVAKSYMPPTPQTQNANAHQILFSYHKLYIYANKHKQPIIGRHLNIQFMHRKGCILFHINICISFYVLGSTSDCSSFCFELLMGHMR